MKILILGSTGLIGSHLHKSAPYDGDDLYIGTYHSNTLIPDTEHIFYQVDITDRKSLEKIFIERTPTIVIHCAAKATPDWCEKNPIESRQVNVEGTKNVLELCRQYGSSLIFMSSNAIFDGTEAPYNEDSVPNPQDVYGSQKWEIEQLIPSYNIPYLIIRTMCVYGNHNPHERKNFTANLIDKCLRGETMQITNDVLCNFISVDDVCAFIWNSIDRDIWNTTYHIAGDELLTHWELTKYIIDEFKLSSGYLTPVNQIDLVGYIKRPMNTCFDCSRSKEVGFKAMSLKNGLRKMRERANFDWRYV